MIECMRFKSFKKGFLLGFADLYVEKWGIELIGVPLYMKDGKRWINFPSKEYQNDQGEKKYMPYYRFREKAHFEAFCDIAKQAIDKWCKENPEASDYSQKPQEYQSQQKPLPFQSKNDEIPF